MSKSRPFSIYLLKKGFNVQNALKEDHELEGPVYANNLPQDGILYLLNNDPKQPWWKCYFGVEQNLSQVAKGALVFLTVGCRCFALSFGHAHFNLKDISYEYDFGLRVTLNCVDPKKLKSTDVLEPSEARRKTTQIPIESDLTYFDFDRDSNIIKRLTGKVKNEYKNLFGHVTGASNLRIASKILSSELPEICRQLLSLYESQEYKITFPGISNIQPIKDPQTVELLNSKVVQALKEKDENLVITVPDIINHESNVYSCFIGCGNKHLFPDVCIENYYQQLEENDIALAGLDIAALKRHKLVMSDDNGNTKNEHSIFACLIFDTHLNNNTECYHLCDGEWYRVEESYVENLHHMLDQYYEDQNLPDYNHDSEGCYNEAVAQSNSKYICLDQEDIRPIGQTGIEPCDLYSVKNGVGVLFHIKVSTRSSNLSHLFNQGVNSIELIKSEMVSKSKFKSLVRKKIASNSEGDYLMPIEEDKYKVVYAIISRKDKNNKSLNLPLFSRISLMRNIKRLNLISGVTPAFCFIHNVTSKKVGKFKPRRRR